MTIKLEEETEDRVAETLPTGLTVPGAGFARGDVKARSLRVFRAEAEAHAISLALDCTGWNRRRAAVLLRISYRGLLYKIRQYNITTTRRDEHTAQPNGRQQVGE